MLRVGMTTLLFTYYSYMVYLQQMEEATKTPSTVQQHVPLILGSICGLIALTTAIVTIIMIILLVRRRKNDKGMYKI